MEIWEVVLIEIREEVLSNGLMMVGLSWLEGVLEEFLEMGVVWESAIFEEEGSNSWEILEKLWYHKWFWEE